MEKQTEIGCYVSEIRLKNQQKKANFFRAKNEQ